VDMGQSGPIAFGPTAPTDVTYRSGGWGKWVSDTAPDMRFYRWMTAAGGVTGWYSTYGWTDPKSMRTGPWTDAEIEMLDREYDDELAGQADSEGPFWEPVTDAAGRYLVVTGQYDPTNGSNDYQLGVPTSGDGAEEIPPQLVNHFHGFGSQDSGEDNLYGINGRQGENTDGAKWSIGSIGKSTPYQYGKVSGNDVHSTGNLSAGNMRTTAQLADTDPELADDEPLRIVPPHYGIRLIRRTARKYFYVPG